MGRPAHRLVAQRVRAEQAAAHLAAVEAVADHVDGAGLRVVDRERVLDRAAEAGAGDFHGGWWWEEEVRVVGGGW